MCFTLRHASYAIVDNVYDYRLFLSMPLLYHDRSQVTLLTGSRYCAKRLSHRNWTSREAIEWTAAPGTFEPRATKVCLFERIRACTRPSPHHPFLQHFRHKENDSSRTSFEYLRHAFLSDIAALVKVRVHWPERTRKTSHDVPWYSNHVHHWSRNPTRGTAIKILHEVWWPGTKSSRQLAQVPKICELLSHEFPSYISGTKND